MAMTRSDIEKMLGPVDSDLVTEIVRTDASAADLAQALSWIHADEARLNDGAHLPSGVVAELVELLEADDDEEAPGGTATDIADWA
jgi:hypothetical protein